MTLALLPCAGYAWINLGPPSDYVYTVYRSLKFPNTRRETLVGIRNILGDVYVGDVLVNFLLLLLLLFRLGGCAHCAAQYRYLGLKSHSKGGWEGQVFVTPLQSFCIFMKRRRPRLGAALLRNLKSTWRSMWGMRTPIYNAYIHPLDRFSTLRSASFLTAGVTKHNWMPQPACSSYSLLSHSRLPSLREAFSIVEWNIVWKIA